MTATTLALPARYRGSELIATGGMADVYAATDDTLERRVAIKILNERFAGDPEIRTRFTREARIAARLSVEPNVVTIFDVADVAGQPAIVMEFLPGGTLADRMRAGRIPPALGLAWLEQAGRALDAAHAAGVVHRDVKPANLMLGADGEVRVTDFGIARIAGDASLTSVGTILGTSGYMSPEQAVGGTATAASDRYGLAVVAFELLCGRRPYLAETFAAEAAAHATAPIPAATSFDRSLPPSIDVVLERCAREGSGGALSVLRRAGREAQVGVRRQRRHDGADGRCGGAADGHRRRPAALAACVETIRANDRHRCRTRCAGAARHRPRRGRRPRRRFPARDHRRQDGDGGRGAAGPHRHGRGAARDSSGREHGRSLRSPPRRPRVDPPSTTRGSGCSRPATRAPHCRFSSVPSPRCRAPAP